MKKTKLLASLITLPILTTCVLPIVSCNNSYKISTTGSSQGVIFNDLPSEIAKGKDLNVLYTYEYSTMLLDETNTDILVGGQSIRSSSSVSYKNGIVFIPASLITGNVTLKICICNRTSCTISTSSSSEEVIFSGLPTSPTLQGNSVMGSYSFDDGLYLDEDKTDILVGNKSIKNETGVVYKNGSINIPGSLVNGDISIKIVVDMFPGELNNTLQEIVDACNTYEASNRTDIDKRTFFRSFKIGNTKVKNEKVLIGSTFKITINGKQHIVRIIDFEHDTIANTNKKAALTCEIATLLSDSNGDMIVSQWDTTNNYNYTNSVLRKNLNKQGSATLKWYKVTNWETWTLEESTETRSACDMLPWVLQQNIKNVTKSVAVNSSQIEGADNYQVTNYNDKLFPLTYTELAQQADQYAKEEGTAYKYWTDHNTPEDRIKKDINKHEKGYYLLATPSLDGNGHAWAINYEGYVNRFHYVPFTMGVSFAFCI